MSSRPVLRDRYSFGKLNEVLELPDLIGVQRNSFQRFLDLGLAETFADISPITDFSGSLRLELEFDPEPEVLEAWRLPDTPDEPEQALPIATRRSRDDSVARLLLWLAALALVVETFLLWKGRRAATVTAEGGLRQ